MTVSLRPSSNRTGGFPASGFPRVIHSLRFYATTRFHAAHVGCRYSPQRCRHRITKSSAYRTSSGRCSQRSFTCQSNRCKYRLASSGEITPPCGVPRRLPVVVDRPLSGSRSTIGALEPCLDEGKDASVAHAPRHHAQQLTVRDAVEVA